MGSFLSALLYSHLSSAPVQTHSHLCCTCRCRMAVASAVLAVVLTGRHNQTGSLTILQNVIRLIKRPGVASNPPPPKVVLIKCNCLRIQM